MDVELGNLFAFLEGVVNHGFDLVADGEVFVLLDFFAVSSPEVLNEALVLLVGSGSLLRLVSALLLCRHGVRSNYQLYNP